MSNDPVLSKDEEIFNLAEVITEGKDAKVPLKFTYPNTDKTIGVYIRPILTQEFMKASTSGGSIVNNVLEIALYDNEQKLIPREIIDKLPAGVSTKIYQKIAEISGIETRNEELEKELIEKYMGF